MESSVYHLLLFEVLWNEEGFLFLFLAGRKGNLQCVQAEQDSPLCHFLCNTVKHPPLAAVNKGYFLSISYHNRIDYHLGEGGGKGDYGSILCYRISEFFSPSS